MNHFRSLSRFLLVWTWRLVLLSVLFANARLYWPSPLADTDQDVPRTLLAQLAANRSAIDSGAPDRMQQLFPEGFYFCHVLHGLTWVDLALRDDQYTQQAIDEANRCLTKLNSAKGSRPFPPNLPLVHGMFYSAWKCSLRAGVVLLQKGSDPTQLDLLRIECDAIRDAIAKAETPFLASYIRSAWPCDTVPAIHAMTTYDRITNESRYVDFVNEWIDDVKERLDPETGLMPHTASLPDGRMVSFARATSQVITLRMLPDINPSFAKRQYQQFRDRFLTSFVGAPCVLEYPSGINGAGDVDSGPLIFGRSISGTVLMMATAQIYGDHAVAHAIAQAGETVGLPWTFAGQKQYVGGVLPIGGIIVAYAHVARPWFAAQEHHPSDSIDVGRFWRWQIHAWSCLIFLPGIIRWKRRRKSAF